MVYTNVLLNANCLYLSLFCYCTSSSRCQHSSWPSSSSSCRSSRSSSSTCSTFRGKDCSPSSPDRQACHCTPSLRVSTSYQPSEHLNLYFHQFTIAQYKHCCNKTLQQNSLGMTFPSHVFASFKGLCAKEELASS